MKDIGTSFRAGLNSHFCMAAMGLFIIIFSKVISPGDQAALRHLVPPPKEIEHLSFGFQESLADSLWVRSIQDFDYCDQPLNKQLCKGQSWLYQMLDATTNLSPQFRIPYATGGLALSVIISDIEGATRLFDKGVKAFPQDWPIAYRAAYHYLYEVHDKKRAAELLLIAAKNGGPVWLPSLVARLYADSGNVELAESLLQEMIAQKQDPQIIERMRAKIASIRGSGSQR